MVMPPKKRPEELLCFFGTRDARRRTAIPKCHGWRDFASQRRWVQLDEIIERVVGILGALALEERVREAFEVDRTHFLYVSQAVLPMWHCQHTLHCLGGPQTAARP